MERGVTKHQWEQLLAAKSLIKRRRDVYLAQWAPDSLSRYCQKVAVELTNRVNHVACSISAVALLNLPHPYTTGWSRESVYIAGPRSRTASIRRNPGWDLIETPWGWSTDLLSTAAVVAADLPLPHALIVTDAVARRIANSEDRFYLASDECLSSVRRRLTETADLPAMRLANPAAESPAESFYRGNMIEYGFREPRCGVPRQGATGAQFFVDLLLDEFAIEVDGRVKYDDIDVLIAEKQREDDLRRMGLDFLRPWAEDVFDQPIKEMEKLRSSYPQAYPHLGITTVV